MFRRPLAAAMFALAALPLAAADGRIPIATAPYTINSPGHYYLTRDVSVSSGTAITISSGDVTLDLNGHTVTNSSASNLHYAIATSAALTGVRVTGGRVRGGYVGLYLYGASGGDYRIDRLQVSGSANTGIQVGAGAAPEAAAVIDEVEVSVPDSAFYGILLLRAGGGRVSRVASRGGSWPLTLNFSTGMTVENSVFTGAQASCIQISNSSTPGIHVRNNTLHNCGVDGIFMNANYVTVEGNLISQCGSSGIQLRGDYSTVAGNTLSGNASYGIRVAGATGNSISRNLVSGTTAGPGIYLQTASTGNSFDWNVVTSNFGAGMQISDAGSTGNIYSYNRFTGNGSVNNFNAGNFSAGGNNAGGANF